MMNIELKLRRLLKNCIEEEIDIENIKLEDKLQNFQMNSLSYIHFIVDIENEFGIEFGDEDLAIYNFLTLKNLVDYIKNKLILKDNLMNEKN